MNWSFPNLISFFYKLSLSFAPLSAFTATPAHPTLSPFLLASVTAEEVFDF